MPKPANARRLRKLLVSDYLSKRVRQKALNEQLSRGEITLQKEEELADLYRQLNELKVQLIKLGCDPNSIGKKVRKIGFKGPTVATKQKGRSGNGGPGMYSLGQTRKTWK
ncbi:hypothetical protein WG622_11430 [Cognatishimia sp. D5M38]|uniref:Uncharacterized protein n=1 Tax=Cognatishimia coralii TaxID=3083254 RepID=A0ABU8QHF6_9RHOB